MDALLVKYEEKKRSERHLDAEQHGEFGSTSSSWVGRRGGVAGC